MNGGSPLLERRDDAPFAWVDDAAISQAQFVADVLQVAQALPDAGHVVNQVSDRYAFTVVFCAVVVAAQTNLLPAQRSDETLRWLRKSYRDCFVLDDEHPVCQQLLQPAADRPASSQPVMPVIADDHIAAIAFTSGSTGAPQAHAKRWGALRQCSKVHASLLPGDGPYGIVATSPSSHMYGLEWALLLGCVAPVTLHCGAAFFPNDICTALRNCPGNGVLVSTPVHLNALLRASVPLPQMQLCMSATAPLSARTARELETRCGCGVLEIYGCSEIGSLASRRPATEAAWRFLPCFDVAVSADDVVVSASFVTDPVVLPDLFNKLTDGTFELLGRTTDLVKVAGKRGSLAQLTATLQAITGVQDGVFVSPRALGLPASERLAAAVVAPGLTAAQVRAALAAQLDPVFLPRPLRMVASLPRSATGKLPAAALAALFSTNSPVRAELE